MKLVIDATMIAPGGGLTGLVNYLSCWQERSCCDSITVFASRHTVLSAVQDVHPDIVIVPFSCGKNAAKRFIDRQTQLATEVMRRSPDVLLTTNSMIANCRIPQVVHQRNSKHFDHPLSIRHGFQFGVREMCRDIAARRAAKRAANNVFVSRFIMEQAQCLITSEGSRWHVVYNGIADDVLDENASGRAAANSPVIAAITSDTTHKDNPMLIRILAELKRRSPSTPWQLSVAGAGDYKAERQLAAKLRVEDQINWLGFLSTSEIDKLLKEAAVLLFPSRLESFGNPPLEAMARRCPVVASNCAAIPEVVGDAGILCEAGSVDDFADAILHIWEDRGYAGDLSDRGYLRACQFRWTESALKMHDILRQACQSG